MSDQAWTPDPLRVRELIDRQDILDCLLRYTRGVDRLDEDLLRSAYHPDAIDDHGIFRGGVEEFIRWAFDGHRRNHHGEQHYVTNHTCEIDGDVAHTETYFVMVGQNTAGTPVTLHGGRYIDQFERRDGTWRIAHRVSMLEWVGGVTEPDLAPVDRKRNGTIARDRTDTSYDRPLLTEARREA
ncbi:nuclear transport factor 2 family protein [Dactylosporangium sp. AC04546]|uniref:nuclear transport factor 2 family protein n=1 Tax=unclassified Dactylosporangium TaxID=2621675 RepID=UPI001EE12613|nr:nuclear transport factor 2 family protein [Dactylosporangium sp. AC04546]WVK80769.1 nuclear transport factor 2 family protein [Dactylosporangium sp. AC04546]